MSEAAKRYGVASDVVPRRKRNVELAYAEPKPNRYQALIGRIFHDHYKEGMTEFEFERSELDSNAKKLNIELPDNLGDVIYSFRYRASLPNDIVKTAKAGKERIIEPAGRARYRFELAASAALFPTLNS